MARRAVSVWRKPQESKSSRKCPPENNNAWPAHAACHRLCQDSRQAAEAEHAHGAAREVRHEVQRKTTLSKSSSLPLLDLETMATKRFFLAVRSQSRAICASNGNSC